MQSGLKISLMAGAALVIVAGGVFAGEWLWQQHLDRKAKAQQQAQAAAEAAEKLTPKGIQRDALLENLHDPESAQFRNVRQSSVDSGVWCGEVNARNRMGGRVGFTRYMVTLKMVDGKVAGTFVEMDRPDPSGEDAKRQASYFSTMWDLTCAK